MPGISSENWLPGNGLAPQKIAGGDVCQGYLKFAVAIHNQFPPKFQVVHIESHPVRPRCYHSM